MGKHYVSYNKVNRPDGKFEMWVSTPCWSEAEAYGVGLDLENRRASEAYVPVTPPEPPPVVQPPNCEGFGGEFLAHAQHEAAEDGDGCTSGACLITRGSD